MFVFVSGGAVAGQMVKVFADVFSLLLLIADWLGYDGFITTQS